MMCLEKSYCGINCGKCEVFIASKDGNLKELAKNRDISEEELECKGCKGDKNTPWCAECEIKKCCKVNGIEFCFMECSKYPCEIIGKHTNVPLIDMKEILNNFFEKGALHGNVQELKEAMHYVKDVNIKNNNGETALTIVSKLRPDLVKILVENGADVDLKDKNNISPLHWAVEYDNIEIVELLLENGATTETYDNLGETPMHWAAWTGHYKSAEILIKYGAKTDIKNVGGTIPLDLAVRQGHEKVIKLLNGK